jgi:hypothetical protein
MTIYTETKTFIEEFEEDMRDLNEEYKEGEIDDEEFHQRLRSELNVYVLALSNRECSEIIIEYGIGNAIRDYYSLLINTDDEDGDTEGQLAYHILYDNLKNYYEKIKKNVYHLWNE